MGSWKNIATLLSAKTKEGGLSVKPTEGLPFLLYEGLEVTFVPPLLHFPRSSEIIRIVQSRSDKALVYFRDITTRDEAEKLEGHGCLVRTEDLPEGCVHTYSQAMQGFYVVDTTKGRLGRVVRVEENPAHPLLVVEQDAKRKADDPPSQDEVFIPAVDAFIVAIDEDTQTIHVALPDGLLEL